jgi:Ca2+/Na+ antiporter
MKNKAIKLRDLLLSLIVLVVATGDWISERIMAPTAPGRYSGLAIDLSFWCAVLGLVILLLGKTHLSRLFTVISVLLWCAVTIYVVFFFKGLLM